MHRFRALVCLLALAPTWCAAQDRRFPYEAVIDADEEFVRSGPGPKYYPTGKVSRGDKVMVHRHDPGGWYMVAPPPGSFSWIQAEYVQRAADGRGRLIANNVVVHVGSTLADERSVYQRTLSKGDAVEVLDEVSVNGERGPMVLYKIKPPAREYRWIAGKSLIPSEGGRARPALPKFKPNVQPSPSINGPVAIDLEPKDDAFAPSPFQLEEPSDKQPLKTGEQSPKTAPGDSLEARRDQLHELDRQFREMIQQEPATWTLAAMEQSYQAIDAASGEESIHKSVEQRLRTLQKYAKLQQDYAEFHQLTTQARQRDAQLASMQKQFEQGFSSPEPVLDASSDPTLSGSAASLAPQPSGTPRQRPAGAKFDGAGIIERIPSPPPGAPSFALVTPDGKFLTYLQPPNGLDLQRYLRQSMGIVGERSYRDDLKADLLVIRGLQPVRLQTSR